jgi:hypothetical protein
VSLCIVWFTAAQVCVVSYPLTLFPPAQILEHMMAQLSSYVRSSPRWARRQSDSPHTPSNRYGTLPDVMGSRDRNGNRERDNLHRPHHIDEFEEPTVLTRCVNRAVLVLITTLLALRVPCFGLVRICRHC